MSEKMQNAPIYYALAQVGFNTVAAMAKYADEIQDVFRKEGYTLYDIEWRNELQVNFEAEDGDPQFNKFKIWHFTKDDRSSGFILAPSNLTFHTTHYTDKNRFIKDFCEGFETVNNTIGLKHVGRIGMRYLDAVLPQEGETTEDYLISETSGINLDIEKVQSQNEYVFKSNLGPFIEESTLIAKIYRANTFLGFPPGISPGQLILKNKFQEYNKTNFKHAVIDIDHFSEGQKEINGTYQLEEQLNYLHNDLKNAFEAIISQHARDTWT
ncbi:TIGR04255 family protein [Kushneria sp. Sum13]|uniref:TIGR04255 family protein n=1 Tax=Kushneria sp. Sum13 TaxID=3459196 RepID=UPI0040458EA9